MEPKKLTKEQVIQALSYVQEFLNSVPINGYENHKRAVACMDNLALVIKHVSEGDKNAVE